METGRAVCSVTVDAAAVDDLILAVHVAAAQRDLPPAQRWRYHNVVGIGTPRLRDLAIAGGPTESGTARPIAAITVIAHHRISVDVVFELDGSEARARFVCSAATPGPDHMQRSWADFLAVTAATTLNADRVVARLCRERPSDVE